MEQEIQSQPQQPINTIPSPARKINKKTIVIIVLAILAMVIGYYGWRTFTIHYDKLGELSFYKDADMELKVVLIHENLPFHYIGNSYSVACQSQNTRTPLNDEYEWKFYRIEKDWNMTPQAYLGNSLGNDKNSLLKNIAEEAKKLYLVKDKNTLVILANPNIYVSFDGCRTFNNWVLKDNILPDLLVESTPEFEKCVEQQKKDKELGLTSYGNCSDLKLTGNNQPTFQDIIANANGYASFKIISPAFKNNQTINVQTSDFGKTWQTTIGNGQQSQNFTEGCVITPHNGEKLEFGDVVSDVRSGAICHFNIHNGLPIYNFHLVGNPEYNTIDRIEITKGNEDAVSQTLEAGMGEPPYRDSKFFGVEDMNFDGYKDIKLMSFWGATGNTGYTYWLFDSSKNLFVENKDLSQLSNPTPDTGTKTITTHSVGGMAGCVYNNGTYKFDETGKLILIRAEKQDWVEASKSFLKTISELKNGKMVTSTEAGKCDNF